MFVYLFAVNIGPTIKLVVRFEIGVFLNDQLRFTKVLDQNNYVFNYRS